MYQQRFYARHPGALVALARSERVVYILVPTAHIELHP